MRVIVAHHVADDLGALAVRPAGDKAAFLAGKQDAAVNRLQTVANIGKGAADDHAHRVIEVTGLHFIDDVDALEITLRTGGFAGFEFGNVCVVAHADYRPIVGGKVSLKRLGQARSKGHHNHRRIAIFPHPWRLV